MVFQRIGISIIIGTSCPNSFFVQLDMLHTGIAEYHRSQPVSYTHLDVYKRQLLYSRLHHDKIGFLPEYVQSYVPEIQPTLSGVSSWHEGRAGLYLRVRGG